jgi:hypothetical protein
MDAGQMYKLSEGAYRRVVVVRVRWDETGYVLGAAAVDGLSKAELFTGLWG